MTQKNLKPLPDNFMSGVDNIILNNFYDPEN